jgi:hypothetical protein
MSLRLKVSLTLALALLAAACKDVKQEAPAQTLVIASFSPPAIPTPNDLALQAVPTLPPGLQRDLLQSFVDAGGFPSDQEVPVTVPLRALAFDPATNRYAPTGVPTIDVATITAANAVVVKIDGPQPALVETESGPAQPGAVIVRKKADASGSRRWAPGRYVFALRGGPNGAKTIEGVPVSPDTAIALTAPNKDLTKSENQPPGGLPPAAIPQLESIRAVLWNPVDWAPAGAAAPKAWAPCAPGTAGCETGTVSPAFAAIQAQGIPPSEVASIATFEIAPAAAAPLTDAGSGQVPLPSNFLLDGARPAPGTNRFFVRNVPAFGAAAAGLATLDGFSTTGMMLAPLAAPVDAATITNGTVFVFELPDDPSGTPRKLRDVAAALAAGQPASAEILIQPPDLNRPAGGKQATTAIGIQPGVAVPIPSPATIVMVPPLKEKKNYAVVITSGVKDLAGNALRRSTLANIVFGFESPLVDGSGKSQIPGVSDADAGGLAAMRAGLAPLLQNIGPLSGTSFTKDDVVMAYTVQTQTVTDTSVRLSAFPYDPSGDSRSFVTTAAAPFDPAAADPSFFTAENKAEFVPDADFLTANLVTVNAIDPATGALNPDPTKWVPAQIPALVAFPKVVGASCTPAAPCQMPLVVWHHGLNGGHFQMLAVANSLVNKGFVVAAIDAPYHGDRAFCRKTSDCTTNGVADGVCTPIAAMATQGDAVPPGTCTTGHLRGTNLTTVASGNYFISPNFFRIRDGFRQHLIDQAALVLALARPPAAAGFPQPASLAGSITEALAAKGIAVDAAAVHYEGLSLGGISGAPILATNPRFANAVLNVPGATLVDVFTNAPAFKIEVDQLFVGLGIDRGQLATDPNVAARYLQTLILAKWILDPADPVNYAANVRTKLPSPITTALGPFSHATTAVLGQLANCDQTVPNRTTVVQGRPLPYGDLLLSLGGFPTTLYTKAEGAQGTGGTCVSHGVLADTFLTEPPGTPSGTRRSIGEPVREDAAEFLRSGAFSGNATVTLQ